MNGSSRAYSAPLCMATKSRNPQSALPPPCSTWRLPISRTVLAMRNHSPPSWGSKHTIRILSPRKAISREVGLGCLERESPPPAGLYWTAAAAAAAAEADDGWPPLPPPAVLEIVRK